MKTLKLTQKHIIKYEKYLYAEEKSKATIEKYIRDIRKFYEFLPMDKIVTKESVLDYKNSLENHYKITSRNSMLIAVNNFLDYMEFSQFKVKLYKMQQRMFVDQNRELSKNEYFRLLSTAKQKDERLYMLLQTVCSTGIRVSEHCFITVEALKKGKAIIQNKGKIRELYFDKQLKQLLLNYCYKHQITSGKVFVTRNGLPLDRSNIWKMMKNICTKAKVDKEKVFPHNLRHLFARMYYRLEKDLVRLASVLGHSSIETTRIYTMSKGSDCMKDMSKLGLLENIKTKRVIQT